MKWFKRLRRNKTQKKSAAPLQWPIPTGTTLDLSLRYGLSKYSYMSASEAFYFFTKSSTVSDAVEKITKEVEQIKPRLKLPDGKYDDKAEVLKKLKVPNGYETYKEMIGQVSNYYLITGTSFFYVSGLVNSKPVELYAIDPRKVSYHISTNEYASDFHINFGIGVAKYLRTHVPDLGVRYYAASELEELFSIKRFSSRANNKVFGDSLIQSAMIDVDSSLKSKFHNVSVIDNGGRLSLVVTFNDNPSDEELKERREALENQLTGPENAGKLAVIGQDGIKSEGAAMTIQEVGKTPKDMDFGNLTTVADRAVYNRFGIPLPLVSEDASTYNNYETAHEQFYYKTILPLIDIIFEKLSRHLLPRYGLDPMEYSIAYNPEEVKALQNERMRMFKQRKELAVETTNEIRSMLPDREPIDGGDILYQPANLVPVGTDVWTEDNVDTTEEQERLARTQNQDQADDQDQGTEPD